MMPRPVFSSPIGASSPSHHRTPGLPFSPEFSILFLRQLSFYQAGLPCRTLSPFHTHNHTPMLSRRIRPFLAHFVPGTGRDFASRGFTIFELMIVVLAILLIAALVVVHFRQVRREAYRDAMLNDLRNYAIAQEMWHSQHNAYAMHPDTLDFRFSKDVSVDTLFGDGRFWGLRVKHSKTDIVCELFGGEGIPAEEIEKTRIRCSDDQIPTPPGSGPGSGGDSIGDPGGGATPLPAPPPGSSGGPKSPIPARSSSLTHRGAPHRRAS